MMPQQQDPTHPLQAAFPNQFAKMAAARVRVHQYLKQNAPAPKQTGMLFDSPAPQKQDEHEYDKLLDMAHAPLNILNHVKDGSLTQKQLTHYKNLYPELYGNLSKEIMQEAFQAHEKGIRPPYKTRQAMSLFLGEPLESSMTPQAIMANQAVYQQMKGAPQAAAPKKVKKGTSNLNKIAPNYETGAQAREIRQQRNR